MRHVDVAIAGGGLAGATAAAMLGKAGLKVAIVDPHPVYPFDFRSEKLAGTQVHVLRRTGLADTLVNAVRAEMPASAEFVAAKVSAISTGAERQTMVLSNGEKIGARLVVMA